MMDGWREGGRECSAVEDHLTGVGAVTCHRGGRGGGRGGVGGIKGRLCCFFLSLSPLRTRVG